MLDVVENIGGKADKANDAEMQVVDNMRKIGADMKKGQVEKVMTMLKGYEDTKEKNGPVRKCLRYIENRPGQFKYKEALIEELPIGSGEIESGNRSVVQKRLKIPGAWWKPETAERMLALRCMRMNGDWERYWLLINPSFARAA